MVQFSTALSLLINNYYKLQESQYTNATKGEKENFKNIYKFVELWNLESILKDHPLEIISNIFKLTCTFNNYITFIKKENKREKDTEIANMDILEEI